MSHRLLTDAGFRRRVAGSDPRNWFVQPAFWRGQPTFVLTLAASIAGVILLAPFTYSGVASLLSLVVQALAVWGVLIGARALAASDVDLALIGELEDRGSDYLSSLLAKTISPMDLARLETHLMPNNPALPAPGPIRLFQQICKEARDRRFESASNLVAPYRDEGTEEVFRLQNLQKIALWLGILGTFLGLLVALRQSGGEGLGTDDAALTALVEQMYGGLFVSFTASVAGLEVAIILGFMLLLLRKRQELCFTRLESAAITLLSAARHSINHDDFLVEFSQVNTAVRDLTGRVYQQTQQVAERLNGVESRLQEQNKHIDAGLERLAGAHGEFERFLRQMSDAEHEFIQDLAELLRAASLKDLASTLREGANEAGERISGRLNEIASRSTAQMQRFNTSVDALASAVQEQSTGFAACVARLQDEVTTASASNVQAIRTGCDRLASEVAQRQDRRVDNEYLIEQLADRMADLNRSIRRLTVSRSRSVGDVLTALIPLRWRNRFRGEN